METNNNTAGQEKHHNKGQSTEDGHHHLAKGKQPTEQDKPDEHRVKTVAPDNDSGKPGPPADKK